MRDMGRNLRQRKKTEGSGGLLGQKIQFAFNRRSTKKKKGRLYLVDNILHGTTSPFTDQIAAVLLPENFKVPSIATFTRIEDPAEHLNNY
jgi:hypothetical protein